jgi:membrane protein YqaA with SNARE-associated domain
MVRRKILLFWAIVALLLFGERLLNSFDLFQRNTETYWWILSVVKLLLVLTLAYCFPSVIIGFRENTRDPKIKEKIAKYIQSFAYDRYKKLLLVIWVLIMVTGIIMLISGTLKWGTSKTIYSFFIAPTIIYSAMAIQFDKLKNLK